MIWSRWRHIYAVRVCWSGTGTPLRCWSAHQQVPEELQPMALCLWIAATFRFTGWRQTLIFIMCLCIPTILSLIIKPFIYYFIYLAIILSDCSFYIPPTHTDSNSALCVCVFVRSFVPGNCCVVRVLWRVCTVVWHCSISLHRRVLTLSHASSTSLLCVTLHLNTWGFCLTSYWLHLCQVKLYSDLEERSWKWNGWLSANIWFR